jgi:hypothetical protein
LFIPLAASPIVLVVVVLVVDCFLGGNSGIPPTAFNLIDDEDDWGIGASNIAAPIVRIRNAFN